MRRTTMVASIVVRGPGKVGRVVSTWGEMLLVSGSVDRGQRLVESIARRASNRASR